MKKTLFGVIVLCFLSGCGLIQNRPAGTIEPQFIPYVSYFSSKAEDNQVGIGDLYSLSVNFSEDTDPNNKNTLGICIRHSDSQQVYIRKSYWDKASIIDREELIFHELGHCLLGLQHDNSLQIARDFATNVNTDFRLPHSIMNPYHLGNIVYGDNREEYIRQLFQVTNQIILYLNSPTQIDNIKYVN